MQLEKADFNVFRAGYAEQSAHGFKPRKDNKTIRLKLPLDWNMDPFKDRNWCFQLHAWRMLQPIWAEFYGRDWTRLKQELMPWILDWHDFHVRRRKKSAFMWYDMAAGLRAQHLALLIDLQHKGHVDFDTNELEVVEALAAMHIAKLRDPAFISKGNHGIFQLVGLRLLGIVWEGRPETKGEEAYSSEQMRKLIESQFGPQGVHVENSPDYHNFAVTHFSRIRPELFPSIAEVFGRKLKQAREVAPWFTLPDGAIVAIGDSEGIGQKFSEACFADAESSTWWGDRVLMRNLCSGGYFSARTDMLTPAHRAEMLVVKGQAFTLSHAHADHLGFEFYAHGQPLFVDSGKFTYNKTQWRSYFTSDRAHNVVGLVGRSFGPYDTRLEASGLTTVECAGEGAFVIEGRVSRGEDFSHRRRFLYHPGVRLVLQDEIDAPEGEVAVVYFHLAEHVDVEKDEGGLAILVNGRRVATLVYPEEQFALRLPRGESEKVIQGWLSPSYGKKVAATVIELTAKSAGLRAWNMELTLTEPRPPQHLLDRPLPADLQVPFHYAFRSDRTLTRPENTERRVVLEYFSGLPDSIDQLVSEMLERGGFARQRSRPEQGGVRAYYASDDGRRVNVLIRPAETFAVRSVGAVGSVYLAFIEPTA